MEKFETTAMLVTPQQAADWLAHDNYPDQRQIKSYHVKRLAAAITSGTFRAGTPVHFALCGGRRYGVDGQHTLSAIIAADRAVWLRVCTDHCESMAEVAQIYTTFNRDLTRRVGEVLAAWCKENGVRLTKTQVEDAVAATRWLLTGFRKPSAAVDPVVAGDLLHVAGQMRDRLTAAELYFEIAARAEKTLCRPLCRSSIMAIGLATLEDQRSMGRAGEFWRLVADDSAPKGHPARALANYLLREKRPEAITCLRTTASCWNAFWDGRSLDAAKPSFQGMLGISLKGTRFRAEQPAAHGNVRQGNRNAGRRRAPHDGDGAPLPLAARSAP